MSSNEVNEGNWNTTTNNRNENNKVFKVIQNVTYIFIISTH